MYSLICEFYKLGFQKLYILNDIKYFSLTITIKVFVIKLNLTEIKTGTRAVQ